MKFSYAAPSSLTARSFLRRSAAHLSKLPRDQQLRWLNLYLDAIPEWPLTQEVSAFDKSMVVVTLAGWMVQVERDAA